MPVVNNAGSLPKLEEIENEIENVLDISEVQLSPEQQATVDEYLDMLGMQEMKKIDAFAGFIREQAARADACRKESQRLAKKARTIESKVEWLKNRYLSIMQIHNLRNLKGEVYKLSIRDSEVVHICPDAELPEDFIVRKETIAPDKRALRDVIKSGHKIPGVSLVKVPHLSVR